ncbi:uncharacterized protein EI90DRAFT_445172 [Cantharellus anzutake]|uniref:uncharacterized protein n=1 Tax=Cantharellus anzutake TaxID=1750568 RepID=UPI00190524BC|nr:uncharacterized protein EI90DRAFT_2691304 [Cantharellus anzutake]XP_038918150.1 uncharacterized protein EI90DRAFT_445172 [Cantharellus anzutake]KAF8318929.1 hypothetical protein EI90DRAFT_2691304 [Cantharellus anzutake]KAF8334644.1 hypothetical protein EI90DRAFT_445172 [Cantharellus anzutake]
MPPLSPKKGSRKFQPDIGGMTPDLDYQTTGAAGVSQSKRTLILYMLPWSFSTPPERNGARYSGCDSEVTLNMRWNNCARGMTGVHWDLYIKREDAGPPNCSGAPKIVTDAKLPCGCRTEKFWQKKPTDPIARSFIRKLQDPLMLKSRCMPFRWRRDRSSVSSGGHHQTSSPTSFPST